MLLSATCGRKQKEERGRENRGEGVKTEVVLRKGQADCLCPNMLAFSKLTWQRRYIPQSQHHESKKCL